MIAPLGHGVANPAPVSLAQAASGMAEVLGIAVDVTGLDVQLHPMVEVALVDTLQALTRCAGITAGLPVQGLLEAVASDAAPEVPWAGAMRACGEAVVASLDQLSVALDASAAASFSSHAIDLWPILMYSPGDHDDTYVDDYVLIVDEGGNDAYYNNAGGSVLEIVDDRPAIDELPTDGCHAVIDAAQGQCILAAAAVLDRGGDDTYGRKESPVGKRDGACTADPMVLRFSIQGAGIAGVGVLIDDSGNDAYVGKTLAQGTGHGGGFGYLRDGAGDDSYLTIRSSQGSAVIGGTGVFREMAGNDTYDFYMPGAIDPAARPYHPLSGGVINDQGFCDRVSRHTLGVGSTGGTASFQDQAGDDSYRGSWHSQGGGFNGFGAFEDWAGDDTYEGAPGRGNGVTRLPDLENYGFFEDRS